MVRYPDTATAQLVYKGQDHALRLVPTASGARYAGNGLEWRLTSRRGQEAAVLSRLGPNEDVAVAVLERCGRSAVDRSGPVAGPGHLPVPTNSADVLAATPPCLSNQLRLNNEEGDAGAGNRANVFGVTNTGASPCTLTGYPAVSLLDSLGRVLTTVRSDQNPAVVTTVAVPANGKVFFDIAWNVVPNEAIGERICPAATRVRVLIPGDPAAMAVPVALMPCGGRIRINPFRAAVEPTPVPDPVPAVPVS